MVSPKRAGSGDAATLVAELTRRLRDAGRAAPGDGTVSRRAETVAGGEIVLDAEATRLLDVLDPALAGG